MWQHWVARAALAWYLVVLLVIAIGIVQLHRHFSTKLPPSISARLPLAQVPHVTVIRPIVGKDPFIYECLASTFRQDYPAAKLSVHFCIPSRDEPSLPLLEQLLQDFPGYDARIYIAEEDPILISRADGGFSEHQDGALGPNPKIRNMSRAYREAIGDFIWIIDCNVWAGPSVAGHMVDHLCGFGRSVKGEVEVKKNKKYKFAHQIPLAVDVSDVMLTSASASFYGPRSQSDVDGGGFVILPTGNRLEEMFLSTSHAKFYTAISTVAIAPCTVGKSNMFRRSHLDALTAPGSGHPQRSAGIDFFSENICEDHLISDLLWKSAVPEPVRKLAAREGQAPDDGEDDSAAIKRSWGNHALLLQPPCVQPLAGISLPAYTARRSRWLRVRKFTVPSATAVEPGTESFVATAGAAYALTTLPYFAEVWSLPPTWSTFGALWLSGVTAWCLKDWFVWGMLQRWRDVDLDSGMYGKDKHLSFIGRGYRRRQSEGVIPWLRAWLGREALAFPIWAWAIFGGVTVTWRGKRFWVGLDMRVHEVNGKDKTKKDK